TLNESQCSWKQQNKADSADDFSNRSRVICREQQVTSFVSIGDTEIGIQQRPKLIQQFLITCGSKGRIELTVDSEMLRDEISGVHKDPAGSVADERHDHANRSR